MKIQFLLLFLSLFPGFGALATEVSPLLQAQTKILEEIRSDLQKRNEGAVNRDALILLHARDSWQNVDGLKSLLTKFRANLLGVARDYRATADSEREQVASLRIQPDLVKILDDMVKAEVVCKGTNGGGTVAFIFAVEGRGEKLYCQSTDGSSWIERGGSVGIGIGFAAVGDKAQISKERVNDYGGHWSVGQTASWVVDRGFTNIQSIGSTLDGDKKDPEIQSLRSKLGGDVRISYGIGVTWVPDLELTFRTQLESVSTEMLNRMALARQEAEPLPVIVGSQR